MKKTKRKEGQLDEGTKQWMERRPELVKRLKEMPESAKAMSHLRVQIANNQFHELFPLAC